MTTEDFFRQTKYFEGVDGTTIEAWLYLPVGTPKEKALVLIAHGVGSQKDMGLDRYSTRYAQAGITSMIFDYRNFGGSDGEPRNLISPSRHVQDWQSAFAYAQSLGYSKIFLHGSSFGGGHVIVAGAALSGNPALAGVISQVPYLGGPEGARIAKETKGLPSLLRTLHAFFKDSLHEALGLNPVGFRIIVDRTKLDHAQRKAVGIMEVTPAQLQQYLSKHPKQRLGGWKNVSPARGLWDMITYKPIDHISNFTAPMLVVAMTEDEMCRIEDIELAVELCGPKCELLTKPGGHFDIYDIVDDVFDTYEKFIMKGLA